MDKLPGAAKGGQGGLPHHEIGENKTGKLRRAGGRRVRNVGGAVLKVVSRSSNAPRKTLGDDYSVSSKEGLQQKKDGLVSSFKDKYSRLKEFDTVSNGLKVLNEIKASLSENVSQSQDCYGAMSAKISEMKIPKGMAIRVSFGPGEKKVSLIPLGSEIKDRDIMTLLQKSINLLDGRIEDGFTGFESKKALEELTTISNSLDDIATKLNSAEEVNDLIGAFVKERQGRTVVVRSATMEHRIMDVGKNNKRPFAVEIKPKEETKTGLNAYVQKNKEIKQGQETKGQEIKHKKEAKHTREVKQKKDVRRNKEAKQKKELKQNKDVKYNKEVMQNKNNGVTHEEHLKEPNNKNRTKGIGVNKEKNNQEGIFTQKRAVRKGKNIQERVVTPQRTMNKEKNNYEGIFTQKGAIKKGKNIHERAVAPQREISGGGTIGIGEKGNGVKSRAGTLQPFFVPFKGRTNGTTVQAKKILNKVRELMASDKSLPGVAITYSANHEQTEKIIKTYNDGGWFTDTGGANQAMVINEVERLLGGEYKDLRGKFRIAPISTLNFQTGRLTSENVGTGIDYIKNDLVGKGWYVLGWQNEDSQHNKEAPYAIGGGVARGSTPPALLQRIQTELKGLAKKE